MTDSFAPGTPVYARGARTATGTCTGSHRPCGLSGCTGQRLGVRWANRRTTFPCTKGMEFDGKAWRIQ